MATSFRQEFTPTPFLEKIKHDQSIMMIGSCFTENMADKLKSHKWKVLQNPTGIIFNPASVANSIVTCIHGDKVEEAELFYLNEAWHSWQHHSKFSSPDKLIALQQMNAAIEEAHVFIKQADWLIITLGSAWVYQLTNKADGKEGTLVANNHKAPADWFYRRLLGLEELHAMLDNAIYKLRVFNPNIKVVFTISPVRHLREGFIENNRSKSLLHIGVQNLVDKNTACYYFPAYELVIDDLRDYRFYAEDMVHPNYLATQYVWDKFVQTCMNEPSKQAIDHINEINAAMAHKVFNPHSKAHAAFKQKYLEKINVLTQQYPYADFSHEVAYFQ